MAGPNSVFIPKLIQRLSIREVLHHTPGLARRRVLNNLNLEHAELPHNEFLIGRVERLELGHQLDPAHEVQGDYLPDILLKEFYPHAAAAGFAAFAFFAFGAFTLVDNLSRAAAIRFCPSTREARIAARLGSVAEAAGAAAGAAKTG